MKFKIAVLPGDGIGGEIIPESVKVLNKIGSKFEHEFVFDYGEIGGNSIDANGTPLPSETLKLCEDSDGILFGAVGDPNIPDHITLQGLLLPMRRAFDQGVCIRPSYLYPGVTSPLAGKEAGEIDLVIFRENTEGEYAPVGGRLYPGTPHETVMQTNVFTRRGTERIIRAAFEHCVKRNKKNLVTSVTKSNAQAFGMVFWDEVFESVANDYPNIKTESLLVDRVAMDLVRWPEEFDVMVASNLFADIISDIAAVATGSMGLAASANVNPEGIHPSMFESVHGAAFDIAGKGIANPLATISAVGLMLEHLGENESARRIEGAVMRSLEERRVVTGDLGGQASTEEVGDEVVRLLSA